jgi:rRNA-processing protein EBP2
VEGLTPDQGVELEKAMHDAALESVKEGYRRLSQLQVPSSRRLDYYAEMLKTDRQMNKIRKGLVEVQQRIEAVEGRKKRQAQKKFSKQLKAVKIEKKKADMAERKNAKPMMKNSDRKEMTEGPAGKDGKKKFGNKSGKPEAKSGKFGGKPNKFSAKGGKTAGPKGGKSFSKTNSKAKIQKGGFKKSGKFNKKK